RFVWSDSSVSVWFFFVFFFSNNLSSSVIYTLSLHDALPILMIIWLFMMMQTSDLVGKLKNYQIYLIPDKPYKKLIAVMIPTFMKVSIIGTLSFIVVGMYYHETFLTIFMYLINMFGYIFIFMS